MRHPSRFDHGTYDASHFNEDVVEGKISKEDLNLVFSKLQESEYWFPNIIQVSDGTHLFVLFIAMFIITAMMFGIGVWAKALFFQDIIFFPFILFPIYIVAHILVKAKRNEYGDEYLEDR